MAFASPVTLPDGVAPMVPQEVADLLDAFERFEIRGFSPWHAPAAIKGVAMEAAGRDPLTSETFGRRVLGLRTMGDLRENGYAMDGRVSVGGKRRRAFTSDFLYTRPDGTLGKSAILWVC